MVLTNLEQHRNNGAYMSKGSYSASLSQTQGRSFYSVIFRHPARRDTATGKPGVRVRRGLGTPDEAEAGRLRDELNELLAEARYHNPAARAEAERRFDSRVVDIFFHQMVPEEPDFVALRDGVIPLPTSGPEGYRRVLFLGTTGAGKTTVVRQLIGTDPVTERFPSTSTARTTIHDTEILFDKGPWRAAVTFVSSEEAREYLNECISAAVLAASQDADEATVLRRLLSHVNQRFRFNYILGNGPQTPGGDFGPEDDDEGEVGTGLVPLEELGDIDLRSTEALLAQSTARVREIASRLGDSLRANLDTTEEEDERVLEEIFEEELDNLLRDDDEFHELADALMDEIEKRFNVLPSGKVKKTRQGWPLAWSGEWPPEKRREFLTAISRFSSNYAPYFGHLLTPLVNGVRVAGPFRPRWGDGDAPKLVLLDGEGLGHTPNSSSSVSTAVSRQIEAADAVLLVDNATQPMQAAPLAAMREVVVTGNARKLILVFTHFDEVKGDNLPSASAKAQHVLASAENVLSSFGEEPGPYAERALRRRVEGARFFLADLHEPLSNDSPSGRRTIRQLGRLLEAIDHVIEKPQTAEARPVYDRMNLALAIRTAADTFHAAWRPRLGLAIRPGFVKEHWARVKALSRRLATGMADEYGSLRPIADLRKELLDRISVFIQSPLRWDGPDPSDDERQGVYNALADGIAKRLLELSTRRVWRERAGEWQSAYDKHGRGSTFVRAEIIGDDIYERAAPIPDVTPSPDRNQFLHEVATEVEAAAAEIGASLL
jgi:hypothetical protein